MNTSIFLAQAFGLYFVIVSIMLIFQSNGVLATVHELMANRAVFLLAAILTVILGILLVLVHNVWVADWRVVITLLCWLVFISGLFRLYFLSVIQKMAASMHRTKSIVIMGCVFMLIGLFLLYHGFIA